MEKKTSLYKMWQIALLLYAIHKLLSFLFPDYKEHVIFCLIGQQNQGRKLNDIHFLLFISRGHRAERFLLHGAYFVSVFVLVPYLCSTIFASHGNQSFQKRFGIMKVSNFRAKK